MQRRGRGARGRGRGGHTDGNHNNGDVSMSNVSRNNGLTRHPRGRGRGAATTGILTRTGIIPDKDGDLDMGAAPVSAAPAKRFSPYGGGRKSKTTAATTGLTAMDTDNADVSDVLISGHDQSQQAALIQFLHSKAAKPVAIMNPRPSGRQLRVSTESKAQVATLVSLSGIKYNGRKLLITPVRSSSRKPSAAQEAQNHLSTIEALRIFLRSRWSEEQKFINLENIDADPTLKAQGIRGPGHAAASSNVGPAIMKLVSEMFPAVESMSLASNHLRNVSPISTVAQYIPQLKNLSLQNNNLLFYSNLEALSGKTKLKELKELILLGNPLRENEIKKTGDDVAYRSEITRRFPHLKMLDMAPVAQSIQFDVQSAPKVKPSLPISKPFFSSPTASQTASAFLVQFFNLYDTNRQALSDIYDPEGMFSIAINSSSLGLPYSKHRTDWKPYLPHSRNLTKMRDLTKKISTLHMGAPAIIAAISALPGTTHHLDPKKFIVEALEETDLGTSRPALLIIIHGEFTDPQGRKSFDRTFVLSPSKEGSRAQAVGLPYVITSDQVLVRGYVEPKAYMKALEENTAAGAAVQTPAMQTSALSTVSAQLGPDPSMTEERATQVLNLATTTRLKLSFALQCLAENGWDNTRAIDAFERLKGQIPAEAYQ